MNSPSTECDEWLLEWKSPFQTHDYCPLYLANGVFGGMLDLSGVTMDLWSSEIGCVPSVGELPGGALCPVTALRTQVFFRNPHLRERGFWIGSTGIHCSDPRYKADPSMPHIAQVYDCRQALNLRTGIAITSGIVALGSSASVWGGNHPERQIGFRTRVIFLKDSPSLGIEIEADADILFLPELILHEVFALKGRGKGLLRHGNEIECDLEVRQEILKREAGDGCLTYLVRPGGQAPYRVRVSGAGCSVEQVGGLPGLMTNGKAFFVIEILPDGREPEPLSEPAAFEAEQCRRWASFWQASDVRLPSHEALWQQRYRASLFYVAQSMGRGAVQPVGLSKPMLPYWYGCFHDTDTYFCRPLLETGHFEEAHRHLAYRERGLAPALRIAAGNGRRGALYPWQADSFGNGPALEIPINSAIIACEAWHHFRISGRPEALASAAAIVKEVFANLCDLLDFSGDTVRVRPIEAMTFSETMTAEDATEARIAFRATSAALLEVAELWPVADAWTSRARRILEQIALPLGGEGGYRFSAGESPEYQRCSSVSLGSFPLHILEPDHLLAKSFDEDLARTIFLFAWLPHQASVVASQLGRREGPTGASELLRAADRFYKPWHAFDEWENRRSVRAATFVTAAGGFCTSIHHMLVAETGAGTWSLFPGVPAEWSDVAFSNLHTRSGWSVSARREGGLTVFVEVRPTHAHARQGTSLRIPDPSPEVRAAVLDAGGSAEEHYVEWTRSIPFRLPG